MSAKHQPQKGTRNEEKKSESDIDEHRVQTDEIEPAKVICYRNYRNYLKGRTRLPTKRILQIVSARIWVKKKEHKKLRTN